jgi:hypothetical protein
MDPNQKLDLRFYNLLAITVFNLNSCLDKLNRANAISDINNNLNRTQKIIKYLKIPLFT